MSVENNKVLGVMEDKEYRCVYCGRRISKVEYEVANGFCGRCRMIVDWKKTLQDLNDFNK